MAAKPSQCRPPLLWESVPYAESRWVRASCHFKELFKVAAEGAIGPGGSGGDRVLQDKTRLVAEANEPGAMIQAVAARLGVCKSLLFTWQRQAREGLLGLAPQSSTFVPVQTLGFWRPAGGGAGPGDACQASASRPVRASGLIKSELGNGQRVRLGSNVNLAAPRRVLAALRE